MRRRSSRPALSTNPIVTLGGTEYASRLLFHDGDAKVFALDSIAASTRAPLQEALRAMLIFAICSFALAAIASFWLARTISRPIDTLSKSLSEMTKTRDFDHPVPATGSILEIDTLTAAFNTMMASVSTAESERQSAYVGSIRALALALDARDPYTAGHSDRVSTMAVVVGRQMHLPEDQLEVLRLGALLHDIGKIGISDAVLRKPGPLTADEFELIREHPVLGARILRNVPFLAPHLPIVEFHHERPDGQGYPHRLQGDEIPLAGPHRPCRGRLRRDDQRARLSPRPQRQRRHARALAPCRLAVRPRRRRSPRRRDAKTQARQTGAGVCRPAARHSASVESRQRPSGSLKNCTRARCARLLATTPKDSAAPCRAAATRLARRPAPLAGNAACARALPRTADD